MTNAERIQANNNELLECIEIAENLPDGSGGGGSISGNIDTCTVKITQSAVSIEYMNGITYTAFENGTFLCKSFSAGDVPMELNPDSGALYPKYILTNVVCNSAIAFIDSGYISISGMADIDGTAEVYSYDYNGSCYTIKAPSIGGEICDITIY